MDNIQKALAVRMGRLGDVILLLPAMAALKTRFPKARLVLLTDHRYAPLAKLCPYIDEVIAVHRLAMRDGGKAGAILSMANLVRDVRRGNFDLVIDFHGFCETQILVGLSRGRYRAGLRRYRKTYLGFCFNRDGVAEDKGIHVQEMFLRMVRSIAGADAVPGGKLLVAPPDAAAKMVRQLPAGEKAALYVGARASGHLWPNERFAELADLIVEDLAMPVVLLGGNSPGEVNLPAEIRDQCRRKDRVYALENPAIGELVSAIGACTLLISNDSGPMHIGPAVGVPTLGLFSLSLPRHYRPAGPHDRSLHAPDMTGLTVEAVYAAARELRRCSEPSNSGTLR